MFLVLVSTKGFRLAVCPVSQDADGAALEPTGAGDLGTFGVALKFGEVVLGEQGGAKG